MPKTKTYSRKVFEYQLGKEVRGYQWKSLSAQMKAAGLPLIVDNLKFVAKVKSCAPRHPIEKEALNKSIEIAAILDKSALGEDIKREVYLLHPNLNPNKFYWVFRKCGFDFRSDRIYEISMLGEVFYRLFSVKNEGRN